MRDLQIVSGRHISTGYSAIRFLLGSVDVNGPENTLFFFFFPVHLLICQHVRKPPGHLKGPLGKKTTLYAEQLEQGRKRGDK